MKDREELYEKAIVRWGSELQIKVAIEECAELIKELAKYGRKENGSNVGKISEEIADVEVMMEQLKVLFKCKQRVEVFKEIKLNKIESWLSNAKP